ncbi:MAG: RnfABCDGE type electron transport complex subunit G [Zetaproteobacteria bacterium]|nr:MAG: RnfABCDGE type electron transport complex subunit G [Zetaproteobacteria bacterium]
MLDREQRNMVLALLIVAVVSTMLLATTDMFTREPIAKAQREALHRALMQVMPPHTNDPQKDAFDVQREGSKLRIYPARDAKGGLLALAWEEIAPDGYSGRIRILMAVEPDGVLHAVRITDHRETPGLGDGIVTNHAWLASFQGKSLDNAKWKVRKDGGDFDQFTGATISPRAVVKAVHRGLLFFREHRDDLLQLSRGSEQKAVMEEGP